MCDEHTQQDADEFLRRSGITRRQFGKLSAAAGMAVVFPPVINAQTVTETDVEVTTPDGIADCFFCSPSDRNTSCCLDLARHPRLTSGL